MSLLAPAFAQGVITIHGHADERVPTTAHDAVPAARDTHHHGHDLDEHGNLAHVLDHLGANLNNFQSVAAVRVVQSVPSLTAVSRLPTAPAIFYRPPKLLPRA
jgi:hypothetical protein